MQKKKKNRFYWTHAVQYFILVKFNFLFGFEKLANYINYHKKFFRD